jgi:hypothetical protein
MSCKLTRKLYYGNDMQHHMLWILEREGNKHVWCDT